ncbi:hypothetical protein D3C87_431580 [compost metagenome]
MNEEYPHIEQGTEKKQKRPVLLTVLCILSFIVVGFGLLGVLFSLIGGAPTEDQIMQAYNLSINMANDMRDKQFIMMAEILEQSADLVVYQQHRFWLVLLVNFVTYATGFMGVLYMLKGKRLGFHLYIIYCLVGIGGMFLIAPANLISVPSIIMSLVFSGLFVFLYSRNLKWMNK